MWGTKIKFHESRIPWNNNAALNPYELFSGIEARIGLDMKFYESTELTDIDTRTTLHGRPFPPDDVRAYWNIVPDICHVFWVRRIGMFYVRLIDGDTVYEQQIESRQAFELRTWTRVVGVLYAKRNAGR